MAFNNDETIGVIKQVNQQLSDLCNLPYTDFYSAERFVALFDLPINNHSEVSTIADLICMNEFIYFNRLSFIKNVINYIEFKKDDKVIWAIQREFKGLGG